MNADGSALTQALQKGHEQKPTDETGPAEDSLDDSEEDRRKRKKKRAGKEKASKKKRKHDDEEKVALRVLMS